MVFMLSTRMVGSEPHTLRLGGAFSHDLPYFFSDSGLHIKHFGSGRPCGSLISTPPSDVIAIIAWVFAGRPRGTGILEFGLVLLRVQPWDKIAMIATSPSDKYFGLQNVLFFIVYLHDW